MQDSAAQKAAAAASAVEQPFVKNLHIEESDLRMMLLLAPQPL